MFEPTGVPAITPHLNDDDPTLPAFTADEAQAHVADPTNQLEISNWFTSMHPMGHLPWRAGTGLLRSCNHAVILTATLTASTMDSVG